MLDGHLLALFLAAATLLAVTPGPGIFYVLTRTLAGGKREGILSAFGTLVGGLVHVVAAAFGLSAVLAASATAFAVVKYAGAIYLVWLGFRMIRTRNVPMDEPSQVRTKNHAFRQGVPEHSKFEPICRVHVQRGGSERGNCHYSQRITRKRCFCSRARINTMW
jgi:threonine/homoserine/homoserine lactone efflux protein